jgi:hypothetical protein
MKLDNVKEPFLSKEECNMPDHIEDYYYSAPHHRRRYWIITFIIHFVAFVAAFIFINKLIGTNTISAGTDDPRIYCIQARLRRNDNVSLLTDNSTSPAHKTLIWRLVMQGPEDGRYVLGLHLLRLDTL